MNSEPLVPPTEENVAEYDRDGATCLRGVLDSDWIERLLKAADRTMASPGAWVREATKQGQPGRFHIDSHLWHRDPDMRALALESPMIDVAQKLLRADKLSFFYDQLFVKDPGTADITRWHQDFPQWPVVGEDIVSIWLALTEVTVESSGVQYVCGSHKWNRLFRAVTSGDPRYTNLALELCPDFFDPKVRQGQRILAWNLQPGDVVCHHPRTIHGAGGNLSPSQRRMGVSLRYCGGGTRWKHHAFAMPFEGAPEKLLKPNDPIELAGVFPVVWERDRAA